MKERIRELAEQAGFVMWSDCGWKPEGEVIDWSSNYDEELEKFAELVRQDEREACADVAGIALLRCERSIRDRVVQAIRARGEAEYGRGEK